MKAALKAVERWGRRLLVRLLAWSLRARPAAVQLPQHRPPRFLVVRLDERLGNLLLTTPLLLSLARRYPGCEIDCLAYAPNAVLLRGLPFLRHVFGFGKWRLFGRLGVVALVRQLRRNHYDVCLDAANPTQPSVTQALLVRALGARASIGYARRGFGPLYTAPVALAAYAENTTHEIDLRLALLAPLGTGPVIRSMAVAPPWPPPTAAVASWLESLGTLPYVVVNLGARLAQKRLRVADYAMVANACTAVGLKPVLAWGPRERHLLAPVLRLATEAVAAPPTTLQDLACLLRGADAVVTADTGPMHLAVALGRPTCGLFVSTPAVRYGHAAPPHAVLDLQTLDHCATLAAVRAFLQQRRAPHSPTDPAPPPRRPGPAARPLGSGQPFLPTSLHGG